MRARWISRGRGWILPAAAAVVIVVLAVVLINLRKPPPVVSSMDLNQRGVALRTVTVYALAPDSLVLVPLERQTASFGSRKDLAGELVEFLGGPFDSLDAPLPPGTRLLHFFESEPGAVTLDFSAALESVTGASILRDRLRLAAVLRTLAENMPPVESVRVLVQGRPLGSWGDHLRLGRVIAVEHWL
jgi:spore germination protein GerM